MADTWLAGFRDILEFEPDTAFFGAIPQAGTTPFQQYWRGQFGNVYDQFLGKQGRGLWAGSLADFPKTFPDFLEGFDFLRNFQTLSPTARGESPARFAPSVRFAG